MLSLKGREKKKMMRLVLLMRLCFLSCYFSPRSRDPHAQQCAPLIAFIEDENKLILRVCVCAVHSQ